MWRGVCAAAMVIAASGLCSGAAWAQSAAGATAGGDVTADEATVLPPIVVESPTKPIRTRTKRGPSSGGGAAASGGVASPGAGAPGDGTLAGTIVDGDTDAVGIFTLGQLDLIGGSTITNEAMWTFNKNSLDQAAAMAPGVTMHSAGGSRAERDIYVRGFDRLRVPLYVDGVRITLPYDNRLDFNRFLTPDLSEIQIQKGYVSVLNGPGGMGGAINLVSRKPTKAIELEGRSGAVFDGDLGSVGQWSAYAFGGTRQPGYYAQVSGNIVDQDHFDLSSDFKPTGPNSVGYDPVFYSYEDGGNRDRSAFEDWRINAKVGLTPNKTDEYVVNYTVQQAEKNAPLHTGRQIVQGYNLPAANNPLGTVRRFWNWPQWDISTVSWLSKTQLGEASYVKTNAYYNEFENVVTFYRDRLFSSIRQESPYDDHSTGGFVELGTELIPMNTLKGAVHYRRDSHFEQAINYNINNSFFSLEAPDKAKEETWSFAAENTFHALPSVDVIAGVSYDVNKVLRSDGTAFPLPELEEWNWQSAIVWSYTDTGKLHADVSSRVRFPTLFDRYSSRFGARTEEPFLQAERATNYEIGWSDTVFRSLSLSGAVFYSDIEDTIQSSFSGANQNGSIVVYNADGYNYGFEVSADAEVTREFRLGGNYTYLERYIDYGAAARGLEPPFSTTANQNQRLAVAASQVEGTPRHEVFLYAAWRPFPQLTLTPSMEIASDRTALVASCASTLVQTGGAAAPLNVTNGNCRKPGATISPLLPNYIETGAFALLNFQMEYQFNENATLNLGVSNLLDQDYALAEGFPEPGRQFFANVRAKF